MKDYIAKMKGFRLCGVPVDYWLSFVRALTGSDDQEQVRSKIDSLVAGIGRTSSTTSETSAAILAIVEQLRHLAGLPEDEDRPRQGRAR